MDKLSAYGIPEDALADYDTQEPMVPGEQYAGISGELVPNFRRFAVEMAARMRVPPKTLSQELRGTIANAERLELSPAEQMAYNRTKDDFSHIENPDPKAWEASYQQNLQVILSERPHMKGSEGQWQAVREMDAWNNAGRGHLQNPDIFAKELPPIVHMTGNPRGAPGDKELNASYRDYGDIGHGAGFYGTTAPLLSDLYAYDKAWTPRGPMNKVFQTTLPSGSVRIGKDGRPAVLSDYYSWNDAFEAQHPYMQEKLYQLSGGKLAQPEYAQQPVGPLLLPVESKIGHQEMLNELGDAEIAGNFHPDVLQPGAIPSKYYPAYVTGTGSTSPKGTVIQGAETSHPRRMLTEKERDKIIYGPDYLGLSNYPWDH